MSFAVNEALMYSFMEDVEPGFADFMEMPSMADDDFSTTFYEDFTIADHFGTAAVRDTFDRAFEAWKRDYRYLTDLVIKLNWKIWEHYDANHMELAKLYDELWSKADAYACDNLQGKDLEYFYNMTD